MTSEHDIDEAIDASSTSEAVAALTRRIRAVRSSPESLVSDGPDQLSPPLSDRRDHIQGPAWASGALMVFGAYGARSSRPLGTLLEALRDTHPSSVCVAWRHLPDPEADPRTVWLALAAEAAATEGRFWSMNRELLAMRHDDLDDLHAAARRAGLDFYRLIDLMSAGTGADRIVADVESARDSAVIYAPALFVNGGRFRGDLNVPTLWAALQAGAQA